MTIEELKQALEAATPLPWAVDPQNLGAVGHVATNNGASVCQTQERPEWAGDRKAMIEGRNRNAHLIVAAVNNLPALLKVVEAAKDLPYLYDQASADPYDVGYSQVSDEIALLRKALEELNDDH